MFALLALIAAQPVFAEQIIWSNWTTAENSTTVSGALAPTFGPQISVTFNGTHSGTCLDPDPGYDPRCAPPGGLWGPSATYTSAAVSNAPNNNYGGVWIDGAAQVQYSVTFGQLVVNPVMSVLSMGNLQTTPNVAITYSFDQQFVLRSSGISDYWGNDQLMFLVQTDETTTKTHLEGLEGNGTIQFLGAYSQISWTASGSKLVNGIPTPVPEGEFFQMVTVGAPDSSFTPEPGSFALGAIGLVVLAGLRRRFARS